MPRWLDRRWLAEWSVIVSLLLPTSVVAQPATIVLVTNHADARVVPLLTAELEASGVTVRTLDRGAHEITPADLRAVARDRGAVAAFRVLIAAGRFEVWLADRMTGKVVLREVLLSHGGSHVDEVEVVLRAVELLRASLLELDAPLPSRGEVAAPPELVQFVSDERGRSRFGVRLGTAVLYAPGGLDPGLVLRADLRARIVEGFGFGVIGALSILPLRVTAAEGSASLTPSMVGGYVSWGPHAPRARLRPSLAIGASATFVDVTARAEPPRVASRFTAWTPAPFFGAALGVAVSRHLHLLVEALGVVTLRSTSIVFDGREAASFGPFVLATSIAIDVVWP
ncbi:MAG: hypothetical protein MUE69_15875 [Myxococcota bacterium]|jgi:hypothetical protein|nr:hypothetical protein [Myxococcota bacterium]